MRKDITLFISVLALTAPQAWSNGFRMADNSLPQLPAVTTVSETPFADKAPVRFAVPGALDGEVIDTAPEGEVIHYSTSGQAFMAIMGMLGEIPVENFDTEMVFCEDGSVYWKNCITQAVPNTYIKGQDLGDRIEFQFPQCILAYPDAYGDMIEIYAHRMKYEIIDEDTNEGWFYVDEENDVVTLYRFGEMLMGDVNGGEAILGMTTPEGEWYGYGNYNIVMTPGFEEGVEVPEDLVTETWAMHTNGTGKFVRVGFDGEDVYFTELFDYMPEAWAKGHIEDGRIVLPNQYVGTFQMMQCAAYVRAITIEYDEESGYDMPVVHDEGLTFEYDAEAKRMTSTQPEYYIGLMGGPGYLFEYYISPDFAWQPAEFEITLNTPVITDCFNYDDTIHYGVVAFDLPATTKEGYLIDPANIWYRMYVDGEPYIFESAEYVDLDANTEWIPFSLSGYDFHNDGAYHRIDHYLDGADSYGIQAMYDDGQTQYLTPVATWYITDVKVNAIDSDKADKVVYYDMMGRRVERPAKGDLLIERRGNDARKVIF